MRTLALVTEGGRAHSTEAAGIRVLGGKPTAVLFPWLSFSP